MLSIDPNPRITYGLAYEDDDLLIVEKPSGRTTLPGKGHTDDTLLNGLFSSHGDRLQNLGRARNFGLLHRLDRGTSGLVIVALRASTYDAMRAAFDEHKVEKYYWAVCHKPPSTESGVIRLPISESAGGQENRNKKKTAHVGSRGRPSLTAFRVLDTSPLGALVEARPVTGRLHQVRVHLDAIGCAILGDDFYGPHITREACKRLALHAHRVAFDHPTTGERIDVRTSWPSELRGLLRRLKLARPDLKPKDEQAQSDPSDT